MLKLFRLKNYYLRLAPELLKQRYDLLNNINITIMSSQKRSLNETIGNGAVKKICINNILTENNKMNLIEKTMIEVLETPDKSEFDKKSYRVIRLENGLKALLISDQENDSKSIDFLKCIVKGSHKDDKSTAATSSSSSDDESDTEGSDGEDEHESEKLSAFCLTVDVGSYSDPRDVQGLSHFLGEFNNIFSYFIIKHFI